MSFNHSKIESNVGLLIVFSLIVVSFAGLVQIVPLFFQKSTTEALSTLKPYDALQLTGRDIYIREGCSTCHSQQVRPFLSEKQRYGSPSLASESVYEHPFLWGSKRTGPDLARIGGRYSDDWHRLHLRQPRDLIPESVMPAFPWLQQTAADASTVEQKMKALRVLGVPYTDADIKGAKEALNDKTEEDAMVAYLQSLGLALRAYEEQTGVKK